MAETRNKQVDGRLAALETTLASFQSEVRQELAKGAEAKEEVTERLDRLSDKFSEFRSEYVAGEQRTQDTLSRHMEAQSRQQFAAEQRMREMMTQLYQGKSEDSSSERIPEKSESSRFREKNVPQREKSPIEVNSGLFDDRFGFVHPDLHRFKPVMHDDLENKDHLADELYIGTRKMLPKANNPVTHPKVELSKFNGESPAEWLRKCERFFKFWGIAESEKLGMIELYLEGKAEVWYLSVSHFKPLSSWFEFKQAVLQRFGVKSGVDLIEEFNKFYQKGSLDEYMEQFESLKTLVMALHPHQTEAYFVSSFMSGLKHDLKPLVKSFKPQTLHEAMELAVLQEMHLDSVYRKGKGLGGVLM